MMQRQWTTCSTRACRGLTLVEVVAAIAILGTVLVGVVLAKARHTRQLGRSQRQRVAVRAADTLLHEWWTRPAGIPVGQSGTIASEPSLAWRTHRVANAAARRLGTRVIRLEVHESRTSPWRAEHPEALLAVELLLPETDEANRESDE